MAPRVLTCSKTVVDSKCVDIFSVLNNNTSENDAGTASELCGGPSPNVSRPLQCHSKPSSLSSIYFPVATLEAVAGAADSI